jgi:GH25 family lysozyme M1 (1,4-beta-N-acetylmuramidase)
VGSRVLVLAAVVLLNGVDVSNHQGSKIDWPQVAGAGYTFAFQKASEGTTFTDGTYALNRAGANAAGLAVGAYHFARPAGTTDVAITSSAIAQADHFVDIAQPRGGDLPPVLDLETTGGLKPPQLVKWTQAWVDEVVARTGARPLVYTSPSFWKTALADTTAFALAGSRLWIAHWTSNASPTVPASNWGGFGWSFWQWSSCHAVPGIPTKCVDVDRAPSLARLAAFPGGFPAPATPPTVVGTPRAGVGGAARPRPRARRPPPPRAGVRLAAVPGTWTGGKPLTFAYQWLSCSGPCTPIPGATLETYTPTTAQVGKTLQLSVTAKAPAGTATAASTPTAVVAAANGATPPAVTVAPAITGTAQVGQTLSASTGTWTGAPTAYGYQWQRCDATGVCTPIANATVAAYVVTPGDVDATLTVTVTATNAVGSQSATAAPTSPVIAAPVPAPTAASAAAQPGQAGAVVTTDGSATVTWQPGAVPAGTLVGLTSTPPQLALALTPARAQLPWPVDVSYATPPTPQQVVGYSTDGRVWSPVVALTSASLPAGLLAGTYEGHVLTRKPGLYRFFVANAWGDPTKVSRFAPRLRRVAPIRVQVLKSGARIVSTRLSAPSQVLVLPTRRRLLRPGAFPVAVRVRAGTHRVTITAIDPYGRRGRFTLSF